LNAEVRKQKIESYGKAFDLLVSALREFPQGMWQYRPAAERWTIHEIIVHIADSEANSYLRCRRFIAEPGSAILGYDEEKWARALDYHAQSVRDALELFKWLRRKSTILIQNQPDAVWANTIFHSENGIMTMDDWLDVYERHIPEHIEQMQANYRDWREQNSR